MGKRMGEVLHSLESFFNVCTIGLRYCSKTNGAHTESISIGPEFTNLLYNFT